MLCATIGATSAVMAVKLNFILLESVPDSLLLVFKVVFLLCCENAVVIQNM